MTYITPYVIEEFTSEDNRSTISFYSDGVVLIEDSMSLDSFGDYQGVEIKLTDLIKALTEYGYTVTWRPDEAPTSTFGGRL